MLGIMLCKMRPSLRYKNMKVSLDIFEINMVCQAEKEYDEKHFLQFTKQTIMIY